MIICICVAPSVLGDVKKTFSKKWVSDDQIILAMLGLRTEDILCRFEIYWQREHKQNIPDHARTVNKLWQLFCPFSDIYGEVVIWSTTNIDNNKDQLVAVFPKEEFLKFL